MEDAKYMDSRYQKIMLKYFLSITIAVYSCFLSTYASDVKDCYTIYSQNGKQQIKTKDSKGHDVFVTPNYHSYKDRNNDLAEKVVAIYDKNAPDGTYGARYILYKPIGKYVGYRRLQQLSSSGYGYEPIWDGGAASQTPCFRTIDEARHYYYPQWY